MEAIDNGLFANGSAVILAGGKSSRMGTAKALLRFDNDPLIVHIARKLNAFFPDLVIVAAPGQELPPVAGKIVRDEVAYQGPVGGIYYGLNAAAGEFCFVTSCDVPFLSSDLITYLVSLIKDHDIVAPYWQDRFQPLCAVYRRTVLPLLSEQLARGELRPIYLYDKVRTRRVGEEEIRRLDPDGLSFFNMNSPEDYTESLSLWQRRSATTCTVELFGVPRLLAKTKEISLALPPRATLADVFSALAERLPVLSGRVIDPQRSVLSSGYACNVNGLKFVRDPTLILQPGDRIFIVAADAGG